MVWSYIGENSDVPRIGCFKLNVSQSSPSAGCETEYGHEAISSQPLTFWSTEKTSSLTIVPIMIANDPLLQSKSITGASIDKNLRRCTRNDDLQCKTFDQQNHQQVVRPSCITMFCRVGVLYLRWSDSLAWDGVQGQQLERNTCRPTPIYPKPPNSNKWSLTHSHPHH